MPKFIVRYEAREYYEKAYEAESFEDALGQYYADGDLFSSSPYDSDTDVIEIEDENGKFDYV
jgi:hypothetical protein